MSTDTEDALELIRGSGNVFRDFGYPDANVLQIKADIAARILGVLEDEKISVREAQERTGFAAADFSRVRRAKIRGFTLDRLIAMLGKLDPARDVVLSVEMRPRGAEPRAVRSAPAP